MSAGSRGARPDSGVGAGSEVEHMGFVGEVRRVPFPEVGTESPFSAGL